MARTVCLLRGDGIGPEVTEAARRVIDAAGAGLEWLELDAGAGALERTYEARLREEAAAIAIQAGRLDDARRHVVALTILEPDRAQHAQRLQAIERLMGEGR